MSLIVVAKKDFRDAIRSRVLIALTLLFGLFTAGGVYVSTLLPEFVGFGVDQRALNIIFGLVSPAGFLVPIISLLVGYKAVAGERESGSLKLLLGLPHTRRDVVLGKVLGRTAVVAVSIIVGFGVGGVVLYGLTDSFSALYYLSFTATTILLGLTFVSLSVGLSSAVGSTTRAAWGAFGILVLFQFVWGVLGFLLLFAVTGSLPQPPVPDWYLLFTRLSPQNAYQTAVTAILPGSGSLTSVFASNSQGNLPFYIEGWFGYVILLFWAVIPLALAYPLFQNADL